MGTKRPKNRPVPLSTVVPANSVFELTLPLKAPKVCHNFVSEWRMCTPDGYQFGDCLWIDVDVEPSAVAAAAKPPAMATSTPTKYHNCKRHPTPAAAAPTAAVAASVSPTVACAVPDTPIGLECNFVADATIPDGSTMQPQQRFDKKWVVETGKDVWPAGCTLVHVGGHAMGAKRLKFKPAPLCAVPANSKLELVVTFQAPKSTRDFFSKWRMSTPDGRQFGDYLWTLITVEEKEPTKSAARAVILGDRGYTPVAVPHDAVGLECKFSSHGAIPDGTPLQPRQNFEKKWVIKTGQNAWPAGCTLVHVGGHAMGKGMRSKNPKFKIAPLKAVPANSELELSVTLKSPKIPRDFISKWRMCTPDGHQFGDYLWVFINVVPTCKD